VIAVMVVATALCADRSAVAAPAPQTRPQPTQGFARGLASRITSSFRRTVAPVRMVSTRSTEDARAFPLPIRHAASGVRGVEISPFQFRLPPPVL
jgi:hypothetical protein